MFAMQFKVSPCGRDSRWVVMLGNSQYGAYLDRERALLDAVDGAHDAMQAGYQAQVWIGDRSTTARVFLDMPVILGPVLTREEGYAFDSLTPAEGLSRGYIYRRIDDACYARNVEIRCPNKGHSGRIVACSTVDEFVQSTV
jgi:hypothetical protein